MTVRNVRNPSGASEKSLEHCEFWILRLKSASRREAGASADGSVDWWRTAGHHASVSDRPLLDTERLHGSHQCAFKRCQSRQCGHRVYRGIPQGKVDAETLPTTLLKLHSGVGHVVGIQI